MRVLILGGGFAGIQTAIQLQKSGEFKVTLVSNRDYLYLFPISIWVPVRIKEFNDVKVPLANIQKKYPFDVIVDSVKEIHAASQEVVCKTQTLNYDFLVVAFGADKMKHKFRYSYFQNKIIMMKKILKVLVSSRMIILAVLGVSTYIGISHYHISLWYILFYGVFLGVIFGKVFCRWVCPMGLIMEMLMGMGGDDSKIKQMYQYHKIGCPIAWISGFLNKYSLFRIKLNEDTCKNCGICDKKCYIVAMEPAKFSLYKPAMVKPGDSYTCSKCLQCVASCPKGSLTYKI